MATANPKKQPPTAQQVADFLKSNMDFARFARLTRALGDQVNDAQLRFIKAWIFEKSFEPYSGFTINYVGQVGCDLIIPSIDARVEVKYTENALYTTSKKILREGTGKIKLLNSHGTNTHKVLPANYADFLIFIGMQGAILLDKTVISKYIDPKGDGILTQDIPVNEGIIIADPTIMTGDNQQEVDFIKGLIQYIDSYIQGIK